jgi:hypothetical protein
MLLLRKSYNAIHHRFQFSTASPTLKYQILTNAQSYENIAFMMREEDVNDAEEISEKTVSMTKPQKAAFKIKLLTLNQSK